MTKIDEKSTPAPASKTPRAGRKPDEDKGLLESIGEAVSAPMRDAAEEDDREQQLERVNKRAPSSR